MRAATGLAECVRRDPGSWRRTLPARALRGDGAVGPPLSAGQPHHGDHLADPHRLADRARRPGDGAVARSRRAVADPPPHAHGLGRRAHPVAHRALRQRGRGAGDELRTGLRLPPRGSDLGVLGGRLRRGHRPREQESRGAPDTAADDQSAHRPGGSRSAGQDPAQRGRQRVRRPELVGSSGTADLRRSRRQDVEDQRVVAPVDQHRRLPRPPVAVVSATERADVEGADVFTDRCPARGEHHVTAGNPSGRTQLGLPLRVDSRLDLRAVGSVHVGPRPRGRRLLLVHRRRLRARTTASGTHCR